MPALRPCTHWGGAVVVKREWIVPPAPRLDASRRLPVVADRLHRPPVRSVALDVLPTELQIGDYVPFSDGAGRPVLDLRAVGPGQRHRRVAFADLPPVTVRERLRVYRDWERATAPWGQV